MSVKIADPALRNLDTPRFTVSVTQQDIDTAIPKNSRHCMISDALKRCWLKKFKRKAVAVDSDLQSIRVTDKEKGFRYIYLTPPIGQNALLDFDAGDHKRLKPFHFQLKGGQIIPTKTRYQPNTEKRKAQAKKDEARRRAVSQFKKARLRVAIGSGGSPIITRVGGEAPPAAILGGKQREFGLRFARR